MYIYTDNQCFINLSIKLKYNKFCLIKAMLSNDMIITTPWLKNKLIGMLIHRWQPYRPITGRNCIIALPEINRGKGTLFRNIQNTGRWYFSALGSRRGSYILHGGYLCLNTSRFLEIKGTEGMSDVAYQWKNGHQGNSLENIWK